jgi:hypothetical protein
VIGATSAQSLHISLPNTCWFESSLRSQLHADHLVTSSKVPLGGSGRNFQVTQSQFFITKPGLDQAATMQ